MYAPHLKCKRLFDNTWLIFFQAVKKHMIQIFCDNIIYTIISTFFYYNTFVLKDLRASTQKSHQLPFGLCWLWLRSPHLERNSLWQCLYWTPLFSMKIFFLAFLYACRFRHNCSFYSYACTYASPLPLIFVQMPIPTELWCCIHNSMLYVWQILYHSILYIVIYYVLLCIIY